MNPDTDTSAAGATALPSAYLRQPTLQGDTVVFVSDDDLWRTSLHGGVAQRLTAGLSEPATPCLSPCGRWLAYTGRDEQHAEVWLMPAAGGPARRMTWLGSELAVRGFTPEGEILFVGNHGQPFFRNWHAYTLPLAGGVPQRLPLGHVNHLAWAADGRRVIGRNTADPARWKRYRGGTAGHLWMESTAGSGQFSRLHALQGNISAPMWLGERLFFISDFEGVGNLYSCRPDGTDLRAHTRHAECFVRHASSDGQRIVYQCGAALWLYDPATDQTRELPISVPSARTQAARRAVPAAEHVQGAALHPAGHSVALEVRGQVFTMGLWHGAVLRHGLAPARRRLAQWLADGQTLLATSDASGEEQLELFAPGAAPRSLPWALGRITALRPAPAGTQVALANHRNELWVGDVASGALQRVAHSAFGRIEDPVWSPCGGWLACTTPTSMRHTAISLHQPATGRSLLATQPEFRDYSPSFSPCGRYLYFLSLRTYDPVYDSLQFELSFPRGARPYLIALQAGGPPPFEPEASGPAAGKPAGKAAAAAAASAPSGTGEAAVDSHEPAVSAALPALQPDGLARRVAAFPVPEGRYGQIAGVAAETGAKVVWTLLPIAGAHGRGGHKEGPGRLEVFSFDTGEVQILAAKAEHFLLAADQRTLLLRAGTQWRAIDAAAKPAAKPPGDKPGRDSGVVDVARVRLQVDPPQEWAQMLGEVWRLQRDHFWTEDMSGVDWPAMHARYAALLPRVATRGELSDLIWELQGELGTSHAYEMGGDHRKPPAVALGHLAADLAPAADGSGWEILRTVQGDPWDAAADSPLNAVGVAAQPGERIVAVGGQPVGPTLPPQALLLQQAGTKVALTLAAPAVEPQAAGGGAAPAPEAPRTREVLVTTLADETPARYREWVERNRAWVHEASGGRVGYFHVPDMMSAGFAEFHRYFGTECDRDALIVDVRYNRGGHVSQLLLEKVARRRIAWNVQRWGQPSCYPDEAPAGAVVALTNEQAGSDGDIFSHAFKLMGIGTLVGVRTWGGVIGIWPRHKLVDGSETTQPEYAFWFRDVGWAVENFGTEPQVVVENAPQDDAFNAPERDRQLAAALAEALKGIDRQGVARPAFGPRPQLGVVRTS